MRVETYKVQGRERRHCFKLAPDGTEMVLHSFQGGTDGSHPETGILVDANGYLYGTTWMGGSAKGCGTVFRLAPDGTETIRHAFIDIYNGCLALSTLIGDSNFVYGTTLGNGQGPSPYEAVFRINK